MELYVTRDGTFRKTKLPFLLHQGPFQPFSNAVLDLRENWLSQLSSQMILILKHSLITESDTNLAEFRKLLQGIEGTQIKIHIFLSGGFLTSESFFGYSTGIGQVDFNDTKLKLVL